jgi:predicted peptidase
MEFPPLRGRRLQKVSEAILAALRGGRNVDGSRSGDIPVAVVERAKRPISSVRARHPLFRKMRTAFQLIVAAIALAGASRAEEPARFTVPPSVYRARDQAIGALRSRLSAANPDAFESFLYQGPDGSKLWYRLFAPEVVADGQKYPLILVLHGAGGRGTDNMTQITGGAALSVGIWTLPEEQRLRPCFVLAPQCPPEPAAWIKDEDWDGTAHRHRPAPTKPLATVMEVLDRVIKENPVDEDRLYVMGVSMGGYGTWDSVVRAPHRFAAAVPVCGALADGQAPAIAHLPVWIFHGAADEVVSVSDSRSAFEQLRAAGGAPRYTEYQSGGHGIGNYAWTEPGLAEWLFAQRRR